MCNIWLVSAITFFFSSFRILYKYTQKMCLRLQTLNVAIDRTKSRSWISNLLTYQTLYILLFWPIWNWLLMNNAWKIKADRSCQKQGDSPRLCSGGLRNHEGIYIWGSTPLKKRNLWRLKHLTWDISVVGAFQYVQLEAGPWVNLGYC